MDYERHIFEYMYTHIQSKNNFKNTDYRLVNENYAQRKYIKLKLYIYNSF